MSCLKHQLSAAIAALALTAVPSSAQSIYTPYTFTTLAGALGGNSNVDGTGSDARFNSPESVAVDSAGNVYVADRVNCTIRKVTPAGVVTTLAGLPGNPGNTDGTGTNAMFNQPKGVAVDSVGNVYVSDSSNCTIRKVTPLGVTTTLAGLAGNPGSTDGTGADARFGYPEGVAVDSTGNVYVADEDNHTIRKITPLGATTTLAGLAGNHGTTDGTGAEARFYVPEGVAVDQAGNVYVADERNQAIRKVTAAGVVTTLAGLPGEYNGGFADGTGTNARFGGPFGVAVDNAGTVYVADTANNTIRKVTPMGEVTTLAGVAGNAFPYGADGTGSDVRFFLPTGVAVDGAGNVYVADSENSTIRKGYPAVAIVNSGPTFGFNSGQFGFMLSGPVGQSAVIEASTDLLTWLPIFSTNTFSGSLNFSDPQSGASSNRFYRAHVP